MSMEQVVEMIDVLPEQLTIDNADKAFQHIVNASATSTVTIDLSTVQHCDSAGIAALIEAKANRLNRQQSTDYQNPNQQLRDLAAFLKVDELLFA